MATAKKKNLLARVGDAIRRTAKDEIAQEQRSEQPARVAPIEIPPDASRPLATKQFGGTDVHGNLMGALQLCGFDTPDATRLADEICGYINERKRRERLTGALKELGFENPERIVENRIGPAKDSKNLLPALPEESDQ